MWDLIVSVPDHCLSFYSVKSYNEPYHSYHTKKLENYHKQNTKMSSFKSNENIHKKEDGPYYVVTANKASSKYLNTFAFQKGPP